MRTWRTIVVGVLVAGLAGVGALPARGDLADQQEHVDFHAWQGDELRGGTADGVVVRGPGLVIDQPVGTAGGYEYATWTSPRRDQGFGATQLIASWNADTPAGTWIEARMRGWTAAGAQTGWYVMGRWASGDGDIQRTSVAGQSDSAGQVDVDTFETATGVTLTGYQLQVALYRKPGGASPTVSLLGAMTSYVPDRFTVPTSAPGGAEGVELPVPRYSQDVHKGQYPQYDGGGEAWCSPTSTEMVVEYWGRHPSAAQLSWVDPRYADPSVDVAARGTYDYSYQGTGNWPFNAAYAASYGLTAHITRLGSLAELEHYVRLGIPVVTSQSFRADELTGAGYSTSGHLMVVVGFTPTGDVIANDPASPADPQVRHVYQRAQFETVWLRTERHLANGGIGGGSGGVVYLITPPGWPLPTAS